MIKHILLAFDGSEPSSKAFDVAADLAQRYQAALHVLTVAQPLCPPAFGLIKRLGLWRKLNALEQLAHRLVNLGASGSRWAPVADQRAEDVHESLLVERLDKKGVVVFERASHHFLIGAAHDYEGNVAKCRIVAYRVAKVSAGRVRHHEVGQDQSRPLASQQLQCSLAVGGGGDPIARILEHQRKNFSMPVLILGNHDQLHAVPISVRLRPDSSALRPY